MSPANPLTATNHDGGLKNIVAQVIMLGYTQQFITSSSTTPDPSIQISNPKSHILSVVCHRLPNEWNQQYNTTPVLIETFVQILTYTGTYTVPLNGYALELHRDVVATTDTTDPINPKKTSDYDRFTEIGDKSSTAQTFYKHPFAYKKSLFFVRH